MRIPYNRPPYTGNEEQYVIAAMKGDKISGDGVYTQKCEVWFENYLDCERAMLTPSCTQALEMIAILCELSVGDEVIMPSFTFVSTANAFVLRGVKVVFVDIDPKTMNIDPELIEGAITEKTKAIVVVHYAGISCDMDKVLSIASDHDLVLIEDAAQAMTSCYKGRLLGTFGALSTFSFHETKNFTSGGEGGLLIVNDAKYVERAEIIREKGTDRKKFFRGDVDKYSWVDIGSSYLPSDIQAAYLWGQLECFNKIIEDRLKTWDAYYWELKPLDTTKFLELPVIPDYARQNGHIFYLKTSDAAERAELISAFRSENILAVFHYVPLHSSDAGKKYSRFHGADNYTTRESERLLRLPLYYGLTAAEAQDVASVVRDFYS